MLNEELPTECTPTKQQIRRKETDLHRLEVNPSKRIPLTSQKKEEKESM